MNSFRWNGVAIVITLVITIIAAALGFAAAWWLLDREPGVEANGDAASAEREILYWVAPMDPNFRRDEPGKSPMGMDLVPVYADGQRDESSTPSIRIDPAVINNIGVRTAAVERGTLARSIDTVGFITPDADRIAHVHVRAEGWIERLDADNVGEAVAGGEVLFEIYSPALVSAQDEFLQAARGGHAGLISASRQRLRALGMSDDQVEELSRSGQVRQRFSVRSPQDGYVMELNVREGMFVQPGTTIMSLADLSEIWVDVDVFEQQIDWVNPGQSAHMRLPFAPERVWHGEVDYVYPTIRPESRTARVRLSFDNPDLQLKPNMYAQVTIDVAPRPDVVHVPSQAVIRTGRQERVVLALGEGRFRPAEVVTGLESGGRTEIVDGLSAGERIVVSSQFLIDSEASMDASLLRMLGGGSAEGNGGDEPDHSGHDMEGMDHSDHDMEGMDHSDHDMEQDAPTPALPREQGREKNEMDHSGHDMEQVAPTPALPREQGREKNEMDHSGHDMQDMDHSGHDMSEMDHSDHDMTPESPPKEGDAASSEENGESTAYAPSQTLPRKQGRDRTVATSLLSSLATSSLPRSRGRVGVGAQSVGGAS